MASPLFRLLTDHFDSFRGGYEDNFEREHGRWRRVVEAVVARYLECGLLEAGSSRLIYEVDPLVCPKYGGTMQEIALIQEPIVVDRILKHLREMGRDARAGPWATRAAGGRRDGRGGMRAARGTRERADHRLQRAGGGGGCVAGVTGAAGTARKATWSRSGAAADAQGRSGARGWGGEGTGCGLVARGGVGVKTRGR